MNVPEYTAQEMSAMWRSGYTLGYEAGMREAQMTPQEREARDARNKTESLIRGACTERRGLE